MGQAPRCPPSHWGPKCRSHLWPRVSQTAVPTAGSSVCISRLCGLLEATEKPTHAGSGVRDRADHGVLACRVKTSQGPVEWCYVYPLAILWLLVAQATEGQPGGIQLSRLLLCSLLRVGECEVTNSGCRSLAALLLANHSLRQLDLSNNCLGDPGVLQLAESLRQPSCNLEKLM